ncbi:uncharacterized protein LOC118223462 isoform X3 [Anguilla anguilla]|uniref:uncharacterized protein LOC118223462 isoform X3 n=1 Tax=Anguilla anguilla TaxID=7936 RepID=UPI0015AE3845|nr:uncharacterized protein LOC118223462 isoform X3 [Anguilla anguilla]
MKDFALSLLSRGCGHVVRTQVDSQSGRIEVCFEPEDYFNWKSSHPLLRLSESGRIRCGAEPAPPKTYSTRKGPLLLYSAELALPRKPEDASRKRRGSQHSVQEVQLQLRTLRDLTGAILAYDKKQPQDANNVVDAQPCPPLSPGSPLVPPVTQLSQTWHPPTSPCDPKKPEGSGGNNTKDPGLVNCFPAPPDSGQIPCSEHSAQCQPTQCLSSTSIIYDHSKDQPVAPNPSPCDCEDETGFLFLHPRPYTVPQSRLPPIPEGIVKNWVDSHLTSTENQRVPQAGDVEDHNETKNLCLRIVVDSPRVQMNPISKTGKTDWGLNSRNVRNHQEGPVLHDVTCYPKYLGAHGNCSATGAGEVGEGPCPLKTAFVDSSWSCSRLSRVTYYGGHLNGTRLGTNCVLDQKGGAAPDSCSFSTLHLPPVPSGPLLKPIPLIWSGPDKGAMKPVGPPGLEKQGGTVRLPPLGDSNISTGAPTLTRAHSPGALGPPQSPEDPHHRRPQRELPRKILLLPLLEHGQSQKADMLRQHGGCHDTQAMDGKQGFCEEFGQEKETAMTGCTNRGSSPTPAMQPKNRVSSPTPSIEAKNRVSSPIPTIQPKNRASSPTPAIQPKNRMSSPTLVIQSKIKTCSPIPAIQPKNRASSPTPVIQSKNRVSSPTPVIQSKNRASSPIPAIQPKNRASSPIPVIQPKELNLDSLGLLESGKEDFPSLGVLPPLGGRKGPGKQSSMALFRQDLTDPHDCCDPDNLQTAVVRGTLPVELREFQKGSAVGTLIMGPDGEIIQLSFWGSAADTNDQQLLDDITRGRGLNASEVMQGQPWALLLQTDTGTLVSDSFGHQANMNQSSLNKQDGVGGELPHGQQGAEESYGLYLVCEEQCSLPKRPREMGPVSDFSRHTTDQQGEEGIEGTWDLQPGPLGLGQKGSKGPLPREEGHSTDPSASALSTGEGNTTGAFLSNKQSANTTAGAMSGGNGQSSQGLVKTNFAADAKEAKRNRLEQQEEADARNREEAEGEQSFGTTSTEATSNSTLGKRKEKGLKEKPQNVSGSQAREKRKGKQRAAFVVGKVRENALERLTEDRMNRPADVLKKLDGVISDGGAKDKDPGKQRGASSTTLGGSINDGDSPGVKLNASVSQSSRALGSGRLSSSDSACCEHTDTPAASRMKSQSAVSMMRGQSSTASMMKGQSPAGSIMNSQSPAFSMMKSQSPAFSMMNLQSPTVSLTEGQLALKVARRETSHENHVNLDVSSNTLSDGSRRGSVAHKEQQGGGRAPRAEQRRMEVERKRAEREEQRKRQYEKEETEERFKQELQKEQEQRTEEIKLQKQQEQEEHQQREEREKEHVRRQQAEREKEKRRQEEKKRQMERFLKIKQAEEERRAAELECLRVEEEERLEEERRMLQGMEEDERQAYLLQRQKEEEQRRREAEERKRKEGEAAVTRQEAMLQLARQRAALEQRLKFRRALREEAEALELAQSVSRPWVYSYYSLLKILGVQDLPTAPEDPADDSH